jgi:hypothetical protein
MHAEGIRVTHLDADGEPTGRQEFIPGDFEVSVNLNPPPPEPTLPGLTAEDVARLAERFKALSDALTAAFLPAMQSLNAIAAELRKVAKS